MTLRIFSTLVLAALALAFVLQNVAAVEVRFLLWSFSLSASLLLLIVLFLGVAIGWLLGFSARRDKRDADPGAAAPP
jgi:uncharacterized integral membrane protein